MRLWCVFEAFIAMVRRITIMLAGERCNLALDRRAVLRPAKVLSTIVQMHPCDVFASLICLSPSLGSFGTLIASVDVAGSLLLWKHGRAFWGGSTAGLTPEKWMFIWILMDSESCGSSSARAPWTISAPLKAKTSSVKPMCSRSTKAPREWVT